MMTPNMAAVLIAMSTMETVNTGERKVRRSSSARSLRCRISWRTMKLASPTTPIASEIQSAGPAEAPVAPPDSPERLSP